MTTSRWRRTFPSFIIIKLRRISYVLLYIGNARTGLRRSRQMSPCFMRLAERSRCHRRLSGSRLIPAALIDDRLRPLAAGDRGEPVGRRQQPVPGVAAGGDDGLVVRPDAMAELVLAQVLPDVLDRVQLGAVARQG